MISKWKRMQALYRDLAHCQWEGSNIIYDTVVWHFNSLSIFFQPVNTLAAELLYSKVRDWCNISSDTTVLGKNVMSREYLLHAIHKVCFISNIRASSVYQTFTLNTFPGWKIGYYYYYYMKLFLTYWNPLLNNAEFMKINTKCITPKTNLNDVTGQ